MAKKKVKKKTTTKKTAKNPDKKNRGRGGRPAVYKAEYAARAKMMCGKYGVSTVDLADFFGVSERTIYKWIEDHPEFAKAMKEGKVFTPEALTKVKKALIKRALGYKFKKRTLEPSILVMMGKKKKKKKKKGEKAEVEKLPTAKDIEESLVVTKETIEDVPPDTGAIKEILHNKCPEEFKDKQFHDVKHGGSVKLNINVKKNYDSDCGSDKTGH
jgi:transposase-like protein